MEKDINTEVSNTQLPATEEKANLKESLRIQKSQWIKEQIKRQREAEDAVLERMIEEQRVIDGLNSDINENLDRTRESRKFNQEFQEKINTQIYEMNGITEDKLKGMREYKNAYYQGCAFSLFLLSVVMIGICGVLHGFESQICLFMIACTGVEGALLAQDKWRNKLVNILCKLLYLMVFPVMMVIFVCYELKYPEYDLFLPYFAMGIVVVLIIGTAAFFFYDPYKQDKKRVKNAKDYISEVEKIAKKQVKKNQKLRAKEEKKNQKIQLRALEREEAAREKEEKLQSKKAEKEARKAEAERIRKEEEQKEIERQRKAEEERIAAEKAEAEKKQSVPEMPQDVPAEQVSVPEKEENVPVQEPEPVVDPFAQTRPQPIPEKKCRAKFFAIGTKEQLKALVGYMKENGIKYGKVE